MKKKSGNTVLILLAIFLVIAIVFGVLMFFNYRKLNEQASLMQNEMAKNQQTVYVALKDIKTGTPLTTDGEDANVELEKIYTGLDADSYMSDDDLGKVASVDIPAGTPISLPMTADSNIEKDTRDYEISTAELMTDQKDNEFVDVRIAFPDGSDYLLLSKKQITDVDLANSVFHCQMNEEEILRYNSAIVDWYSDYSQKFLSSSDNDPKTSDYSSTEATTIHNKTSRSSGARIYVTRYVQPSMQDAAEPTYPVNEKVYDLISNDQLDPNVITAATHTLNLQARLSLENRLGNISDADMEAVQGKIDEEEALLKEVHANALENGDGTTDTSGSTDTTVSTDTSSTDTSTSTDSTTNQ